MSLRRPSYDVVIIGSGISSLTAAAVLARRGRSVCVLERHAKVGGYLHCFSRFGERFDTGAHYIGAMDPGAPFHVLLSYLGVHDPSLFVELDPDGFDVLRFPSFEARIKHGYARTLDGLAELFPAERAGLERYFREVRDAARLFPTYEFNDELDEAALLGRLETPLARVVRREIRDPRLQCVLYTYCYLHGVSPEEVGFGFHALVTDSVLRGACGFRHGGEAVARRFVEVIERHGGKVFSRCGVKELRARSGLVTEIITDTDETITADWIISGIHPRATFRLVKDAREHFRPAFLERLERLPETSGIFGIYSVCRGETGLDLNRNYYFHDREDPARFFDLGAPDSVPTVAFAARPNRTGERHGALDPLLFHAPGPIEWFEPWRETRYGRRGADYTALKERRARAVFEFVERFVPGVSSRVEKFVTSTPLSNLHFNGSENGSAYGVYHDIAHSGARSLGPRTHLKNLLLTGQGTLFPGLFGAATSGIRTAGALVGIKPLLRELKRLRENA